MYGRKTVLVTGGAGFLGSHLCDRLIAQGANVLCVDNFYTGARDNIVHLVGHPQFELMRHDVTFPLYVEVGEIYTLAGLRNVADAADPLDLGSLQRQRRVAGQLGPRIALQLDVGREVA